MRILLVEDDPNFGRTLERSLAAADHACTLTGLGEEAVELAKFHGYDLILLDLGLPDLSGQEVLRRLRQAGVTSPVLVLTGDDRLESKIEGFREGADDYLTKPFDRQELLARISALLRRSRGQTQATVWLGNLAVNLDRKVAEIKGVSVGLSGKEFGVVELLARRRGTVVSKDALLKHLYGAVDEPPLRVLDVFVCKLRRKLAAAGVEGAAVETVYGEGYIIRETARAVGSAVRAREVA